MHKEEFIKALEELNINITKKQLSDLDTYYKMLIDYNSHTNLTRITDEKEVYLKHFYDSLTLVKAIKLDNQSLLDVGTGAGFPGLVLKIIFPNLKITLVDSLNKRIVFLNYVIETLRLSDIKVIHTRAEEYALNNREKYDIVTSRAVAQLNMLSELCLPMVKIKGYFIPMKAQVENEIDVSKKAIKTLGGELKDKIIFKLPYDAGIRTLIKIKKITKTSVKYPRKFSEIKKKPL
ncbi:MAG: 16S rRNA (guanine(527)-N(7))-methyltransferase RsmG [Candidatus Aphodocola sp.]